MMRFVSAGRLPLLFLPLAFVVGSALFPLQARAETITLTGGQVSISSTFSTRITADLIGQNFELHVFDDLFFRPSPNRFLTCTIAAALTVLVALRLTGSP